MEPCLAASTLDWDGFARVVYRSTPDRVKALPPQWRGFVAANLNRLYDVESVHGLIGRGGASGDYDPQGTFDAFQGQSPQ